MFNFYCLEKICISHGRVFVMPSSSHSQRTCVGLYVDEASLLRKHAHMIQVKINHFQRKIVDTFLIFPQNIDCGYTLEPPRRGDSNEYPQSMFWSKNKKK